MIPEANVTKGLNPNVNFDKSNGHVLHLEIIKFLVPLDEFGLGTGGSADSPTEPTRDWMSVTMGRGIFPAGTRHPVHKDEFFLTDTFPRTIGFGMEVANLSASLKDVAEWSRELTRKDERAAEARECMREASLSGNWRFFLAGEFMIGMAPAATQAGDQLCFIPGARVPFVMRERKEAGGGYILADACYIHSYMHGRIVEDLQKGQVQQEWVDLYEDR